MPILVQKYGGTSVNSPEKRALMLDKIITAQKQGYDVVVVVSAMGRRGEPYATDTFLDMLTAIGPAPVPRTKDLIAACGEIISTCVVAHALEQRGYRAVAMTGFQAGIATTDNFTNAEIIDIKPDRVHAALAEGNIVVVAGFQGITEKMDIATLGRGGSDTTAIALGGALGAELVEIYTDVPGIAFTDPRLLPEAPYLKSIDFETMYLLARAGAKVVHQRAVKTAINYKRPFAVRSTFNDDPGTVIGLPGENFGGLYGIAVLKDVAVLRLEGIRDDNWRKLAVDEMFYGTDGKNAALIIQAGLLPEAVKTVKYSVSEPCELVTVMWDKRSGVTEKSLEQILSEAGIKSSACFHLSGGAAWAIPAGQSKEAVGVLYGAKAR